MNQLSWNNLGKNVIIVLASIALWRGAWHAMDALEDSMKWGDRKWMFGLLLAAIGIIVLINMDPTMTEQQPSTNVAEGHLYASSSPAVFSSSSSSSPTSKTKATRREQ